MGRDMQELYCNDCRRYLRFKTKPWKNGRLIIVCDYCSHQHCRIVKKGIIADMRWDRRNGWFQKGPKSAGIMANSFKLSLWEEERRAARRIN